MQKRQHTITVSDIVGGLVLFALSHVLRRAGLSEGWILVVLVLLAALYARYFIWGYYRLVKRRDRRRH